MISQILQVLKSSPLPHVYIVGGAIRSSLLGKPIKDIDLVIDVSCTAFDQAVNDLKTIFEGAFSSVSLCENQYGVVIFTLPNNDTVEVAKTRVESYDKGVSSFKPATVRDGNLREDCFRRDFTVNTLLCPVSLDISEENIIDISGRGLADLRSGVLDTPQCPDVTFTDDPTRILRMAKFSARLGFKPSDRVLRAAQKNFWELKNMPWEPVGNLLLDIFQRDDWDTSLKSVGIHDEVVELINSTRELSIFLSRQVSTMGSDALFKIRRGGILFPTKLNRFQENELKLINRWGNLTEDQMDQLDRPKLPNDVWIREFGFKGAGCKIPSQIAKQIIFGDLDSLNTFLQNPSSIVSSVHAELHRSHKR